jgi:hypothetical protein
MEPVVIEMEAHPSPAARPMYAPIRIGDRVRWKSRLRRRRFPAVSTTLVLLMISAGVGRSWGLRDEHRHWALLYHQAVLETGRWEAESVTWMLKSQKFESESQRWRALNRTLKARSRDYQSRLVNLRAEVKASVGNLRHPSFGLWTGCGDSGLPDAGCPLLPGSAFVGGLPDTFDYFVSFRSTVPVTVWIMAVEDFVCWATATCDWHPVAEWKNRTELTNGVFHEAEGCAGYLGVWVSEQTGILYPDVRVVRNPASHPTGVCRQPLD